MNSLKSICSFAKLSPVTLDQLQEDVDPLFRREVRIKLVIRSLGFFEASKQPDDLVHE